MNLIDTHSHIYLPEFDEDRDDVVEKAVENKVTKLLMPNIDAESILPMLSAVERYKGICYPMIGIHPLSVKNDFENQLAKMKSLISRHHFVAIGEIGLDFYRDKTHISEQISAFRKQLALALETGLPAVIHIRNAFPEVFRIIDEFKGTGLNGVFHAFSGGGEEANKACNMGFMLGIGGVVTFKNSSLQNVVRETDPSFLVLETDSPYLAPEPFRGKRNDSSMLYYINNKLAELLGSTTDETAEITTQNAIKLFRLDEPI
ncbi:MAG: TatD family hydrolase [Bacteroidales bacterium]|nr:TatD family hydrolase [Bacteroidales bacterium]